MHFLALAALLAAVASPLLADPKVELGEINGAQFRIDIPENWNGGLVLYCHGYNQRPGKFDNKPANPLAKVFLDRGYAIAQSGYAGGGWAIEEAMVDTDGLRRYFTTKYGKPKETWVTGHSMGGFLTMAFLERFPALFEGGLALCGPLAPPAWFMARGLFDGMVVFDYYFPGVLPDPSRVVVEGDNRTVGEKIGKALASNPEKAAVFRRIYHFKSDRDAAGILSFGVFMAKELQERTGGNPFDNRDIVYTGSPEDEALNDGVKRYTADPKAAAYLKTFYTPTGKLEKPMLAIHTVYDPLVPAWMPNHYRTLAELSGSSGHFAQQYVKRDGHCTMNPPEIAKGFDELRDWVKTGQRPSSGDRTVK